MVALLLAYMYVYNARVCAYVKTLCIKMPAATREYNIKSLCKCRLFAASLGDLGRWRALIYAVGFFLARRWW